MNDLYTLILGIVAFFTQLGVGIGSAFCRKGPTLTATKAVTFLTLLSRGALAAASVGIAVIISSLNGIAAGLASVFPSIFLTTCVSLWYSQGAEFTVSTLDSMLLGSLAVSGYALCFSFLRFQVDLIGGVFLSYAIAVCFITVPILFTLRKFRRSQDASYRRVIQESEETWAVDNNELYGSGKKSTSNSLRRKTDIENSTEVEKKNSSREGEIEDKPTQSDTTNKQELQHTSNLGTEDDEEKSDVKQLIEKSQEETTVVALE